MDKFWITVIPFGEENAIHLQALADILGMTTTKTKAAIKHARISGIEICSTCNGYFFPKDESEKRRFVQMQHKSAISRFQTSRTIRKSLQRFQGQMSFEDVKKQNLGGTENGEEEKE